MGDRHETHRDSCDEVIETVLSLVRVPTPSQASPRPKIAQCARIATMSSPDHRSNSPLDATSAPTSSPPPVDTGAIHEHKPSAGSTTSRSETTPLTASSLSVSSRKRRKSLRLSSREAAFDSGRVALLPPGRATSCTTVARRRFRSASRDTRPIPVLISNPRRRPVWPRFRDPDPASPSPHPRRHFEPFVQYLQGARSGALDLSFVRCTSSNL